MPIIRVRSEFRGSDGRKGWPRGNITGTLTNNPVKNRIVTQELNARAREAVNRARQLAPRGKGEGAGTLRRSHYTIPARPTTSQRAVATFGNSAPYARAVNQGSGEYVGRGRIRPKSTRMMAWKGTGVYALGSGEKWGARYTRGQPPKGWLQEAYNRTARARGAQIISMMKVPKALGAPGPRDPDLTILRPRRAPGRSSRR